MINKKGQLGELGNVAIGIGVLAVLLTVTFLILDQGRDQALDLASTVTGTNVTYSITADAFFTLDGGCNTERDATIVAVWNETGANIALLNSGNYTVSGRLLNVSDDALGGVASLGSSINVSYSCAEASYAFNSTARLTNATNDIPGWVSLIVITVVGGILLGLVAILRKRRE